MLNLFSDVPIITQHDEGIGNIRKTISSVSTEKLISQVEKQPAPEEKENDSFLSETFPDFGTAFITEALIRADKDNQQASRGRRWWI